MPPSNLDRTAWRRRPRGPACARERERERERALARVSSGRAHRGSAGRSWLDAGVGIGGGDEGDAVSSRTRARRGSQGGLGDDGLGLAHGVAGDGDGQRILQGDQRVVS
jgi:hypothetical protein